MSIVYTQSLPELPYNEEEILRYCGVRALDLQTKALLEECLKEVNGSIQNRVCYCEFDILKTDNLLNLGFADTESKLLFKHLSDCKKIVLFAATVGLEIDRLISKYSRISPAKAVMLQAICTERIETLCDAFEEKIKSDYEHKGMQITGRVSAGYGDIPLELQKDIFKVLDCPRKIGLTLNDSLLMSPTKSVTGIIGIGASLCCEDKGCKVCEKQDCSFRRKI